MTREEIDALPIGTEVLVRSVICDSMGSTEEIQKYWIRNHYGYAWLRPEDIHSIAPPKPLVVGDRVEDFSGNFGEIIAIHRDEAWVDYSKGTRCFTRRLTTLTRITDAPK